VWEEVVVEGVRPEGGARRVEDGVGAMRLVEDAVEMERRTFLEAEDF